MPTGKITMLFVDTKTVCLIKEMKRSSFSDKGCARVCRGSRIFTSSFMK